MPDPSLYHQQQLKAPYRSTEVVYQWLTQKEAFVPGRTYADVACGMGGNTLYFARHEQQSNFIGIDYNTELITSAERERQVQGVANAQFMVGDAYALDALSLPACDGLLSLQTLSWLEDFQRATQQLLQQQSRWLLITSLFYEGEIDAFITLHNYHRANHEQAYEQSYYNVYSLPRFVSVLRESGYTTIDVMPFEIDTDLPRPEDRDLGTYTETLHDGRRLQFSAMLHLPWYFIYAERAV